MVLSALCNADNRIRKRRIVPCVNRSSRDAKPNKTVSFNVGSRVFCGCKNYSARCISWLSVFEQLRG